MDKLPVDEYPPTTTHPSNPQGEVSLPALTLDPEKYRQGLAEFDMTPEQENELLAVLWNIMSNMVDMGFGIDSTQLVLSSLFENVEPGHHNKIEQREPSKNFNDAVKPNWSRCHD